MRRATRMMVGAMLVAGLAGGCRGEPRIDATTDATAQATLKAMCANFSEDQTRQFAADMATLNLPAMMRGKFTAKDIAGPLHGLTAAQVHDRARAQRAAMGAARAK